MGGKPSERARAAGLFETKTAKPVTEAKRGK